MVILSYCNEILQQLQVKERKEVYFHSSFLRFQAEVRWPHGFSIGDGRVPWWCSVSQSKRRESVVVVVGKQSSS